MFLWALLVGIAGAQCPYDDVGAATLDHDLTQAYAAYAAQDVPAYVQAFNTLETEQLRAVAHKFEVAYYPQGKVIFSSGDLPGLALIRKAQCDW